MATNNVINLPKCTFCAYNSASQADSTGDGTSVLLAADTAVINEGNYYNTGTYTYAVPFTGPYSISSFITLSNLINTHIYYTLIIFVDGVASTTVIKCNPYACMADTAVFTSPSSAWLLNCIAGQLLTFSVRVNGGTKTVSIDSGSYIMGTLII